MISESNFGPLRHRPDSIRGVRPPDVYWKRQLLHSHHLRFSPSPKWQDHLYFQSNWGPDQGGQSWVGQDLRSLSPFPAQIVFNDWSSNAVNPLLKRNVGAQTKLHAVLPNARILFSTKRWGPASTSTMTYRDLLLSSTHYWINGNNILRKRIGTSPFPLFNRSGFKVDAISSTMLPSISFLCSRHPRGWNGWNGGKVYPVVITFSNPVLEWQASDWIKLTMIATPMVWRAILKVRKVLGYFSKQPPQLLDLSSSPSPHCHCPLWDHCPGRTIKMLRVLHCWSIWVEKQCKPAMILPIARKCQPSWLTTLYLLYRTASSDHWFWPPENILFVLHRKNDIKQ